MKTFKERWSKFRAVLSVKRNPEVGVSSGRCSNCERMVRGCMKDPATCNDFSDISSMTSINTEYDRCSSGNSLHGYAFPKLRPTTRY